MELKAYWRIVLRRWWIIVLLVAVVFGASLLLAPKPTTTYTATMRFTIGLAREAQPGASPYYDPAYYDWLVSEYITDDFSEIVKSAAFAADVSQCAGQGVAPGMIQGAANTQKQHRILTLTLSGQDEAQVTAIASCAAKMLSERNAKYFAQLNTYRASIQIIDGPTVSAATNDLRGRLDLPVRVALALFAGIALAFLIDYLDDSVRGASDVEALDLSVLAEIPRAGRRYRR